MPKRILIVDDEAYIADGTAALLRAKENEWDIEVLVSYLSSEALEIANMGRVDILVTDIRMPNIDGLELSQRIRELWPLCRVILLTAHKQFEYAYRAIKMNDVSYVLKVDGTDALVAQIDNTISDMDNAALKQMLIEQAQKQAKASLPLLRREWLLDVIHGAQYTQTEIDKAMAELSIPVHLNYTYSMVLVLLHRFDTCDTLYERFSRVETLQQLVQSNLPSNLTSMWTQLSANRLIWFLGTTSGTESMSTPRLDGMLENIQRASLQLLELPISFNYLPNVKDWTHLRDAYQRLDAYQAQYAISGLRMWIANADISANITSSLSLVYEADDGKFATQWRYAYENGDPKADELLSAVLDHLRNCESTRGISYKKQFQTISVQFNEILERQCFSNELAVSLGIHRLFDFSAFSTPEEAASFFTVLAREIRGVRMREAIGTQEATIKQVEAYIHAHMSEDISLTTLADVVHLNASYLSRIYKQMRGENLMQYVANAKFSYACKLLRKPLYVSTKSPFRLALPIPRISPIFLSATRMYRRGNTARNTFADKIGKNIKTFIKSLILWSLG